MVRYVEKIGIGKGNLFAGARYCGYSWRFQLELSEGPSHFVDLKEEAHVQNTSE